MACMVGDGGVNSSREKVSRSKVGNIKTALVIKNWKISIFAVSLLMTFLMIPHSSLQRYLCAILKR